MSSHFQLEIELSLQSCASLVDHFPNRAAHPPAETETLLRARECFQPEFTRSQSLTLPNYLQDDVVAMMIEVTIMVRKLAMTTVRNSEVS